MSRKLEDYIPPFSLMSEEEQLDLIKTIRHKRFTLRPSMVKTAKKKTARKTNAKKEQTARKAVSTLSANDKAALIAQLRKEMDDGDS